jgi:predicted nucleic acid-binding protein
MTGRFFLDTNVFVYSFDGNSAVKARRASRLINQAIATRKGLVSYQVVQEFFNVALRRFDQPLTSEEAEQYLVTVFRPMLVVHSSHALYHEALQVVRRYRLPWYDALIVAGAIQAQCEILYSEDFQHGQQFGQLEIQNPFRVF